MSQRPVLAITGASAGIGAALALRAARAGYAVVAVGRNAAALETLHRQITLEGAMATTLVADVRDPKSSKRIADHAFATYGRLDVLVANAGIAGRGPLCLQTDDELREQLETHVLAPIMLVRDCLPLLAVSKGTAFVVGSGVARMPIGGMGLYPGSKAALRSAARTLRRELRPLEIGVTYVDPGAVDTEFMQRREMPGAPKMLLTSPHTVARAILRAVERRPAELNVVPWQSALLTVAELLPALTDFALARAGAITGAPIATLNLSRNDAVGRLRDLKEGDARSAAGTPIAPSPDRPAAPAPAKAAAPAAVTPATVTPFVPPRAKSSSPPPPDPAPAASSPAEPAAKPEAPSPVSAVPKAPAAAPKAASGIHPAPSGDTTSSVSKSAIPPAPKAGEIHPQTPAPRSGASVPAKTGSSAPPAPPAGASPAPSVTPLEAPSPETPPAAAVTPAAEDPGPAKPHPHGRSFPRPSDNAITKIEDAAPAGRVRPAARAPKAPFEEDAVQAAITPYLSRMRRLNFPPEMLRSRLRAGAEFHEDELALDWVGMPNKNERKLITDLCIALSDAGILKATGDRQWSAKPPPAHR